MAAHKEKIFVQYPMDVVMQATRQVTTELKWRLLSQDAHKLVIQEPPPPSAGLTPTSKIEATIQQLSDSIGIEVSASFLGFGGSAQAHVQEQARDWITRLHRNLDLIGTPEQQEERRRQEQIETAKKRDAEMRAAREAQEERRALEERLDNARREQAALKQSREPKREKPSDVPYTPPAPAMPVQVIPAAVPLPVGGSLAEELEKLAKLRDQGILTEEEFKHTKMKLLGL